MDRSTGGGSATTIFVPLTPFDVQISLNSNSTLIDYGYLTGVVNEWMTDGFNQSVNDKHFTGISAFSSVLVTQTGRRFLLDGRDLQTKIITVAYNGFTYWVQRDGDTNLPGDVILSLQNAILLDPNKKLLVALKKANETTGFGPNVANVWAFLLPSATTSVNNATTTPQSTHNDQLQVIIIVAVVVAGVALTVLSLAMVWAWRHDRKRRDAYRREENGTSDSNNNVKKRDGSNGGDVVPPRTHAPSPDGTGSSSSPMPRVSTAAAARIVSPPPSEIEPSENGGGVYEESLISEDISTSLSAYYRSGLVTGSGHTNASSLPRTSDHFGSSYNHPDRLNDAGSLSSMESYGYSLDGYTSIAGASLQPSTIASIDIKPTVGDIRKVIEKD